VTLESCLCASRYVSSAGENGDAISHVAMRVVRRSGASGGEARLKFKPALYMAPGAAADAYADVEKWA
jgi:hypothetical protein